MTRRIFHFDPPDRFVCGALGLPGQRTFYLQASKGRQVVSVALEKAQVAVLAERLATLLLALRERGVELADESLLAQPPEADPLVEPVVEQFRVGVLTLAWDAERAQVVIEAREMTAADLEENDEPETETESEEDPTEGLALPDADAPDGPDLVRVHLPPADAHAFVGGAVAAVQAGRPPCPLCGEPLDASGHFCVRRNGYTH
ncbi:MAG TPA: DUF3090 family protein [Candidatus Limnocylindria bacterium]|nr:DUF3090 family protein [Candidatus Limnocylindria bacterium]